MGGNRSNETELSCNKDTIGDTILDHSVIDYGDTIDRMLIAILLVLMAIVFTFMAIILRNLRIPWLWRYVGLDN